MARKKRNRQDGKSGVQTSAERPTAAPGQAAGPAQPAALAGEGAMPAEVGGIASVLIFALMMFLAPALGVPNELMLQDTLKSIVVAFAALARRDVAALAADGVRGGQPLLVPHLPGQQ